MESLSDVAPWRFPAMFGDVASDVPGLFVTSLAMSLRGLGDVTGDVLRCRRQFPEIGGDVAKGAGDVAGDSL